jgi:spore germination cell wall hydrolase CwlJ-like protein
MKKYMYMLGFVVAVAVAGFSTIWVVNYRINKATQENDRAQFAHVSVKEQRRQLRCMADNIYWEAADEPAAGKIAVAQVVMNRVAHPDFPKDPCRVIYQKSMIYDRVVCQFSWLCKSAVVTRKKHPALYQDSYDAAVMVMMEGMRLPGLQDALYYHADYMNPRWGKTRVAKIGHHIFYKP